MSFFQSLIDSITSIISGRSSAGGSGESRSALPTYTSYGYTQKDSNTIETGGETFTKGFDGNYHSNSWFSSAKIETDWMGNPKTDFWGNPVVKDE